jgi:transcriptional regulator with XRE-family HTH domain
MIGREVRRFGEKLRALRMRRKLSLRTFAAELGVAHTTISEIENGRNRPTIDFVYTIANYFGVTTDDLLRDEREV